jgi:hypothetical protein
MITCRECIQRLYPDDPRVKSGKYNMSACEHYCSKPQYYRDLELPKPEPEIPDTLALRQLKYQVEQARSGYLYLQNKINEHLDKSKKKTDDMYV